MTGQRLSNTWSQLGFYPRLIAPGVDRGAHSIVGLFLSLTQLFAWAFSGLHYVCTQPQPGISCQNLRVATASGWQSLGLPCSSTTLGELLETMAIATKLSILTLCPALVLMELWELGDEGSPRPRMPQIFFKPKHLSFCYMPLVILQCWNGCFCQFCSAL